MLLVACLFATFVTSCRSDELTHTPPKEESPVLPKGNTTELRGFIPANDKARFLGCGFNLLHYRVGEVEGITHRSVLSQSRLSSNAPWSPWGGEVLVEAAGIPQLQIEEVEMRPRIEEVQDVTERYNRDSIEISVNANLKKVTLKFEYSKVNNEEEKVHRIRQYAYKVSEHISWIAQGSQTYRYYLDETFVNSLRNMSADTLINTYGTHVITGYSLGAFSELLITARQSVFSKNEVLTLTGSAFSDKVKPSSYLGNKVQENINSINTTYRQGGSEYTPPTVSPLTLFSTSLPTLIDLASWEKGIQKGKSSFISILRGEVGIIPIPDLIENLNLKVKYASAIAHTIHPKQDIIYVLCSPNDFEPVKYNGEYVYTSLKQYLGGANYVYYGNNSTKRLSEKQLTGNGSSNASWRSKLDNKGLWVFYNTASARYLCRDFKMRRKDEDHEGLRYWALNPIIPEEGYSQKAWSRMMIQADI